MAKNFLANKDVCIVAYAETKIGRRTGKSAYELSAEVAAELYRKTKMGPLDFDGLTFSVPLSECGNPFWSNYCSDYLGISPTWIQTTDMGGGSATGNAARAAMALKSGMCETVMLICSDAPQRILGPDGHPGSARRFRPADEPLPGTI
jgi:acetyl-CoA acetyltransferase